MKCNLYFFSFGFYGVSASLHFSIVTSVISLAWGSTNTLLLLLHGNKKIPSLNDALFGLIAILPHSVMIVGSYSLLFAYGLNLTIFLFLHIVYNILHPFCTLFKWILHICLHHLLSNVLTSSFCKKLWIKAEVWPKSGLSKSKAQKMLTKWRTFTDTDSWAKSFMASISWSHLFFLCAVWHPLSSLSTPRQLKATFMELILFNSKYISKRTT